MRLASIGFAVALCAAVAACATVPQWQSYSDGARGFSLLYPPGWKVKTDFADYGYGYYQGEKSDQLAGVAFIPTGDLAPGTNLNSERTFLAVQTLPKDADCQADRFIMDPPPDYFADMPDDTPDFARLTAEPGDLYGIEEIVHVVSRTPCVAVHYYIEYSQIDQRNANMYRPYDRTALLALFDRIRASLTLTH